MNDYDTSFIDKIIYINLDFRVDRRASIERELSVFPQDKYIRLSATYDQTNGYIGCAQSHIRALEMAIHNNWKNVLIVEDDMLWNKFSENYNGFKKLTENPFDVIILGGSSFSVYDQNTLRVIGAQAPVAYFVNQHYFSKLLDNFKKGVELLRNDNNPSLYCLDQYWKHLQQNDLWYIVRPILSIQAMSYSDIENRVINLESYYISSTTIESITTIQSIQELFTILRINLFVQIGLPEDEIKYTQYLLPFSSKRILPSFNTINDELQLIHKCIVDVMVIASEIDTSKLTSDIIKKTRYILLNSKVLLDSFSLLSDWNTIYKDDSTIILQNKSFLV